MLISGVVVVVFGFPHLIFFPITFEPISTIIDTKYPSGKSFHIYSDEGACLLLLKKTANQSENRI